MDVDSDVHFVGVDVGTGSARACIIDQHGNMLTTASTDIQTWQSQPGSYEQSTPDIWKSICISVRQVLADTKVQPSTVQSITFAATCSLAVFTHDTNEPVSVACHGEPDSARNVILWMHHNATKEAASINSTNHPSIEYLGSFMSPAMALAKVLWLKNNMSPEIFGQCQFWDLHDALSAMATGIYSPSQEYPTGDTNPPLGFGVDGTIKGWNGEVLQLCGLESLRQNRYRQVGGVDKNGNHLAVGAQIGPLCESAAQDLGLTTTVSVVNGAIDCYAAWAGTVGAQIPDSPRDRHFPPDERIALVAGTSACHVLASSQSAFVPGIWGPYHNFLTPDTYTIAGGQAAVGRLLRHVVETHPARDEAEKLAKAQNATIFDFLNHHLHHMQSSSHAPDLTHLARHIFFYGDLFGNRSPIADSSMTGSIIGLTGDVSVDNLAVTYLAAMEFLTLQSRHIIATMKQAGHRITSIFMSGSLCLNPIFVDLLATVCDLPVVLPRYVRAAPCYGAALIAACASAPGTANLTVDADSDPVSPASSSRLWSTMTRLSKSGTLHPPSADTYARALLEVKYKVFLEQAERQRVFRRWIDDIPLPT